jgi:hypothetical protein
MSEARCSFSLPKHRSPITLHFFNNTLSPKGGNPRAARGYWASARHPLSKQACFKHPVMKSRNEMANETSRHGSLPGSSVPVVQPLQSALPDKTMSRMLDLELLDLDSDVSSARNSLPHTALLPVSFSHTGRRDAVHKL